MSSPIYKLTKLADCASFQEGYVNPSQTLTEKLGEQMAKGAELDALIRLKLGSLGYEF